MQYLYFWHGPFSQWHKSPFTVDGVEYNCAEQYMMADKARLFKDAETEKAIMASDSPRDQKKLGRSVKNFVADEWNKVARDVVYKGNHAKFTQNSGLLTMMLETGDFVFVEASPYDTVWGIGLSQKEAEAGAEWRGTNWLGEVLTKLRDKLKEEHSNETSIK